LTEPLILAGEVVLVNQFAVPNDQHRVDIGCGSGLQPTADAGEDSRVEARICWSRHLPSVIGRSRWTVGLGYLRGRVESREQNQENKQKRWHNKPLSVNGCATPAPA
jgi:hypothetical protein